MHVVFVCSEFPYESRPTGGFGSYVNEISKGLSSQGCAVTIICRAESDRDFIDLGRHIIALGDAQFSAYESSSKTFLNRIRSFFAFPLLFSLKVVTTINRVHKEKKVDLIEGGDFGAELFFYLLFRRKGKGPGIIVKLHTPSFVIRIHNQEKISIFYWLMESLERYTITKADVVYSPTHSLAKLIKNTYGVESKAVIPYPLANRKKTQVKRSQNIILYCGKFQTKKGVFTLLEAFKIVVSQKVNAKLFLIGPDTIENGKSIKKEIRKTLGTASKNKVEIKSPVSQKKLDSYFSKAAVTVVPSYWENFPNVIFEATVCGSPIIASEVGGIPEMLKRNEEAILVPPFEVKALAKSIVKLLLNKEEARRLAKNALTGITKKFSSKMISSKTLTFYKQVLKEKKVEARLR